jgi:hypothetical protein
VTDEQLDLPAIERKNEALARKLPKIGTLPAGGEISGIHAVPRKERGGPVAAGGRNPPPL